MAFESTKKWAKGVLGGFIAGGATAASAWIALAAGHSAGMDVPVLNLKALGMVFLIQGISNTLTYLKQSPLPNGDYAKSLGLTSNENEKPKE